MVVQSAAPLFSTSWGLFVQNTAAHTHPQRPQNQKARRDEPSRASNHVDPRTQRGGVTSATLPSPRCPAPAPSPPPVRPPTGPPASPRPNPATRRSASQSAGEGWRERLPGGLSVRLPRTEVPRSRDPEYPNRSAFSASVAAALPE